MLISVQLRTRLDKWLRVRGRAAGSRRLKALNGVHVVRRVLHALLHGCGVHGVHVACCTPCCVNGTVPK